LLARRAAPAATLHIDLAGSPNNLVPPRMTTLVRRVAREIVGQRLKQAGEAHTMLSRKVVPCVMRFIGQVCVYCSS